MATAYRTVSEEMAWTDWSSEQKRHAGATRVSRVGMTVALAMAAAMLAGAVFLLPAGIN